MNQKNNDVTSLVSRLRKRAEIRRSIPRGEPDRIADLLEEAADELILRYTELRNLCESAGRDYYGPIYDEMR